MGTQIGPYLISPLLVILILSGITGLLSSVYLIQYRKSRGIIYLSLMQLSTAIWAFFYGLEYSATELELKIFWSKFSYLGIVFSPIFFYFFSLYFADKQNKLTKTLKYSLLAIATLFVISVATNDLHHLHWQSYSINPEFNTTIYKYGISFWLVFAFCYLLLILSIANIIPLIFHFPEDFQHQIILVTSACLFPVVGNVMYVFNVSPVPNFDWTPIFFVFSGIILSYINLRYGTFKLIPIARNQILDILPDGVLIIDNHLRIADINQSFLELIKLKRNEVIGRTIIEIFPQRKSFIEQIVLKEYIAPIELESIVQGTKKFFDIRVTTISSPKKSQSGHLIVFRDITDKANYENQISKANHQLKNEITEKEKLISDLDAFDHTVAHDLKNVIGSIVTSTDLMQLELERENYDNLREINELIKLSAEKSFHVIKELLALASVRQQDIKTEMLDMSSIFAEAKYRVADMIKSSNAEIIEPEDWPAVSGYAPWVEEVWVNFLSNAIKYGGKPPVIEVGTNQFYGEKKIRYWIKDNGKGLTKNEQQKLFKKYERFNQTHIVGHGLGLSIVKRIVEKLGGKVGVISNAIPGEGCLFHFTLPND